MLYAKLPDGVTESQIHTVTQPDDYTTAEDLLRKGFLPLHYTDKPADEPGVVFVPWYRIADGSVVQFWVSTPAPPPPPRTFSKYRLKLAIADAGFLSEFTQMLESVEVKPGYSGADAFADAVTLDEDNAKFAEAVALAKTEFGLTDAQVEAILAASIAE